ncbi:MAG: FeoA domain-containing protein [Candidatus Aureabacteria bacterium]|nr:FeoA domain-containing protein [Candidatus Auribacterota bacterium]
MIKLSNAKIGSKLTFISANGGRCIHHRLAEMGLVSGEKIKVLYSTGHGQVIVHIKGSKVAFGHGLAQKIVVREE